MIRLKYNVESGIKYNSINHFSIPKMQNIKPQAKFNLLLTINFSFSHSVFKKTHLYYRHIKTRACWGKG